MPKSASVKKKLCLLVVEWLTPHRIFKNVVVDFNFSLRMHRQIYLLAEDGMSPALTKKKRLWCDDRKRKQKKEEKEETQPRAELEASMQQKGELNELRKIELIESEPQEARKCKCCGK